MNPTQWYGISGAAILVLLVLYVLYRVASPPFLESARYYARKHFIYPWLFQSRYCPWLFERRYCQLLFKCRYWNVTRLEGAILGGYFAMNGFCMGLGVHNISDLMLRSGTMASVNLIPLFLGGRTNLLANYLGISIHTYYLAHHWVGRVAIMQGVLHMILVAASGQPWTFDSFQISGISATSALALLLVTSLYIVRQLAYEIFLKVHFLLSFIVVIALVKHLQFSSAKKWMYPVAALSLWALNTVLRLLRIAYYNRTTKVEIRNFYYDQSKERVSAIRIDLTLRRPLSIRPGQYGYLFLSDMGIRRRFESHPYVITWWNDSLNATDLAFLVQPQTGISAALAARNSLQNVTIDGPYGKDLHLEGYETVILIANGIGIAGILPYIRYMTFRRASYASYRKGLITRKIDFYWVLEDNAQEEWISDWLVKLQEVDSKRLILSFTCFYPDKKSKDPSIELDEHWRCLYQIEPEPVIKGVMEKQIQRSAGRTKVAVCGKASFNRSIRKLFLENMNESGTVEFAEAEFQPEAIRNAYPGIRPTAPDDLEANRGVALLRKNRLKRSEFTENIELKRLTKTRIIGRSRKREQRKLLGKLTPIEEEHALVD